MLSCFKKTSISTISTFYRPYISDEAIIKRFVAAFCGLNKYNAAIMIYNLASSESTLSVYYP